MAERPVTRKSGRRGMYVRVSLRTPDTATGLTQMSGYITAWGNHVIRVQTEQGWREWSRAGITGVVEVDQPVIEAVPVSTVPADPFAAFDQFNL